MSASTLSAFFIFLGTAGYELFIYNSDGTIFENVTDPYIQYPVRAVIYANALWFYYAGAYAESAEGLTQKLRDNNVSMIEWWIRVINQTLMLLIIPFLHRSPMVFSVYLLLLHITYMAWDHIVKKHVVINFLINVDRLSFVACVLFLFVLNFLVIGDKTPPHVWAALGVTSLLYLFAAGGGVVFGLVGIKYNPFAFANFYRKNAR